MDSTTVTNEQLFELLASRILDGGMSIKQALGDLKFNRSVYYKRIAQDEGFAKMVEELRRVTHEAMEDELLAIAEDESLPIKTRTLRCNTMQWVLARRVGRFREKQEIEHKGIPDSLTDEQRAVRLAEILDAARARRSGSTPSES